VGDREVKYQAWRRVLEDRGRTLSADHRRYNKLLLIGLVLSPLILIWSKLAAAVVATALILATTGHYIAMMYQYDYQRQRERLDVDLERFAEEEKAKDAPDQEREKYDAVRVPRQAVMRAPFSKR
jgi:hypothetical protein